MRDRQDLLQVQEQLQNVMAAYQRARQDAERVRDRLRNLPTLESLMHTEEEEVSYREVRYGQSGARSESDLLLRPEQTSAERHQSRLSELNGRLERAMPRTQSAPPRLLEAQTQANEIPGTIRAGGTQINSGQSSPFVTSSGVVLQGSALSSTFATPLRALSPAARGSKAASTSSLHLNAHSVGPSPQMPGELPRRANQMPATERLALIRSFDIIFKKGVASMYPFTYFAATNQRQETYCFRILCDVFEKSGGKVRPMLRSCCFLHEVGTRYAAWRNGSTSDQAKAVGLERTFALLLQEHDHEFKGRKGVKDSKEKQEVLLERSFLSFMDAMIRVQDSLHQKEPSNAFSSAALRSLLNFVLAMPESTARIELLRANPDLRREREREQEALRRFARGPLANSLQKEDQSSVTEKYTEIATGPFDVHAHRNIHYSNLLDRTHTRRVFSADSALDSGSKGWEISETSTLSWTSFLSGSEKLSSMGYYTTSCCLLT